MNHISVKQRALADITPKHLHAIMAGLLHDIPLMLATLGGRGSEAGAQGMAAKIFGRETGMSNVALDDQGDSSISETPGTDFATLRDRPENRTTLDCYLRRLAQRPYG